MNPSCLCRRVGDQGDSRLHGKPSLGEYPPTLPLRDLPLRDLPLCNREEANNGKRVVEAVRDGTTAPSMRGIGGQGGPGSCAQSPNYPEAKRRRADKQNEGPTSLAVVLAMTMGATPTAPAALV